MGALRLDVALVLATPLARAHGLRVHTRRDTDPSAVGLGGVLATVAPAGPLAVRPGGALATVVRAL